MGGPLVFLGAGAFAVPLLKALHGAGEEVALVVTQPGRPSGRGRKLTPTPVAEAAMELGLPTAEPENVNAPEFLSVLRGLQPEFLVLADYGQFLKSEILNLAPGGAINLHPSLLPHWRGPAPVVYTLLSGDPVAGVTIMKMDLGMDSGPVLAQEEAGIPPAATYGELAGQLAVQGAQLLVRTLAGMREGKVKPLPQDESAATFSRLIGPELTVMDWELPASEAAARINALSPRPGVKAYLGGRMVKLLRAEEAEETGEPGAILSAGAQGIVVGTGGGSIRLLEVHPEGRKPISARDFANSGGVASAGRFDRVSRK